MSDKTQLKVQLYQACADNINQRINTIRLSLYSLAEARNNETKSSVGDKHETGRAMMQLEEEKFSNQLAQALEVQNELKKINPSAFSTQIGVGSLVITNSGLFYLSIGIGKLRLGDQTYFCISHKSPIGTLLWNKKKGEHIEFNGRKIEIEDIL
ncbi:MAG: hypothetical protein KDC34_14130 [Saprospiraceae bacterium]|nr:hypothetical protein [Saprospiraceae bacterium]